MAQPKPLKTTFEAIFGIPPTADRVAYGNRSTHILLAMDGKANRIDIPAIKGAGSKLLRFEFADPTSAAWFVLLYCRTSPDGKRVVVDREQVGMGTAKFAPLNEATYLLLRAGEPIRHMVAYPDGFNMLFKAKLL